MVDSQSHRGPDDEGTYLDRDGAAGLGHNRLSILDLSVAGRQPMGTTDRRLWIVFNGEIYNYLELRAELSGYPFRTQTDTEVILAAYERWGEGCVERFIGMFAFLIWDRQEKRLFAARDRFGVKPLYYALPHDGALVISSEIKALHAAGVPRRPDHVAWATYLTSGHSDYSPRTFWDAIFSLPAGHLLTWQTGEIRVRRWYDLAARVGASVDERPAREVEDEYLSLLTDSVRLRFRSDVPVGINLSGGLDSSTLLGIVQAVQGQDSDVKAFTFITEDARYDELPWVRQMLERTRHPLVVSRLLPADVPALAQSVHRHEEEPYGGIPTLAYARLFEHAREEGVIVLLDGQGMDEQWAGYDYYPSLADGKPAGIVQATRASPVNPECLVSEFRALAEPFQPPAPFADRLRNVQYRDLTCTKIPRALRFNDRVSMRVGTELREPFLDHRLVELALRQPPVRKIADGQTKVMLRTLAGKLLPESLALAPKRPLQTPQREWLRGPLVGWADELIREALRAVGGSWLDVAAVHAAWQAYQDGAGDSSFHVWQWVSLGLMATSEAGALHG